MVVDTAILTANVKDWPRCMGDRLLTVIFAHRGIPTPTAEVDAAHPPLEVVHGIRVSPIRAAWASGIRGTALSLSLKALRSLLLLLTDSMLLIFLPANPPRNVRKWRS